MTTDPNWLEIVSELYTQEVSQSARNLHEEADQIYTLIETIETALGVDLNEQQVESLILELSRRNRDTPRKKAAREAKRARNTDNDVLDQVYGAMEDILPNSGGLHPERILKRPFAPANRGYTPRIDRIIGAAHDLADEGGFDPEGAVPSIPATYEYPAEDGDPSQRVIDDRTELLGDFEKRLRKKLKQTPNATGDHIER